MFCSATPTLKKRSGYRAAKSTVRLALPRSAVSTTTRGSRSHRSASSSPATNAGIVLASIPMAVAWSLSPVVPLAVPRKTPLISCPELCSRVASAMRTSGHERLKAPLDLRDDVVVVGALEVADMPLGVALHPLHAAALDRVGDDQLGRGVIGGVEGVEDIEDRIEVVAVDGVDPPAEALKALGERLEAHDRLGLAVDREVVAIDDADERAELELVGRHRGLPDLALVELAVAHQAVDAEGAALHAGAERHADAHRQAVAERARAEVDPGDLAHVRVVAEGAVEPGIVLEQRGVEEPDVGQDRVEADAGVTLAEDEAVTVGPAGLLGPVAQLRVVERGEQLGGRERAGVVAGAGDPRQPHGLQTDELGAVAQALEQLVALRRSAGRVLHGLGQFEIRS